MKRNQKHNFYPRKSILEEVIKLRTKGKRSYGARFPLTFFSNQLLLVTKIINLQKISFKKHDFGRLISQASLVQEIKIEEFFANMEGVKFGQGKNYKISKIELYEPIFTDEHVSRKDRLSLGPI